MLTTLCRLRNNEQNDKLSPKNTAWQLGGIAPNYSSFYVIRQTRGGDSQGSIPRPRLHWAFHPGFGDPALVKWLQVMNHVEMTDVRGFPERGSPDAVAPVESGSEIGE
jgi:hypothetical protein